LLQHDLVNSLLPLSVGSPEVRSIKIDYNQRIEDPFVDVAQSIVQAEDVRIERLGPLLAAASAKNSKESSAQLPSRVPDWRIASQYMFDEHRQTVEFIVGRLEYDRHPIGGSDDNVDNRVAIQRWKKNFPKGLRAVEGGRLLLQGRLLKPCFPPAHRQRADNGTASLTEYCGPQGDRYCWMCQLFEVWDPADQDALEAFDEETQALFMIPRSRVIFVLNRDQASTADTVTLAYCFSANRSFGQEYEKSEKSVETLKKLFQVLDNITLV
jgi:hypothetical protein